MRVFLHMSYHSIVQGAIFPYQALMSYITVKPKPDKDLSAGGNYHSFCLSINAKKTFDQVS